MPSYWRWWAGSQSGWALSRVQVSPCYKYQILCISLTSRLESPEDGRIRYHGDANNVFGRQIYISVKMLNVFQRRLPSLGRKVHCLGEMWSLCVFLVFLSPQRCERRAKTSLPFSWWASLNIWLSPPASAMGFPQAIMCIRHGIPHLSYSRVQHSDEIVSIYSL